MTIQTIATPNRNRPEAKVIDKVFYEAILLMRQEVANNTSSYKGKVEYQKKTLEFLDGCIKNIRTMGSLTDYQIKWLKQTSNVCLPKGNINTALVIPKLITVSEYYSSPNKIEEEEEATLSIQEQIDLMVELLAIQQKEIEELQQKIKGN